MKKFLSLATIAAGLFIAAPTFAHVIVTPAQVGIGATQVFTVSVPNERDGNTTSVRLVLPDGLQSVMPTIQPGWKVTTKKDGTGDSATVTEITWSNGALPAGQRDQFSFSAQVPAQPTTLNWKAYQTYQDGTVVSWDQTPTANEPDNDSAVTGPYSKTSVNNDLQTTPATTTSSTSNQTAEIMGGVAIILSLVALIMAMRKKTA